MPLGLIIIIVLSELKESKDVADELKSQTNVLNNNSLESEKCDEPQFYSLKKLGEVRGEFKRTGAYRSHIILRFLGEIEDVLQKDISKLLAYKSQGIFTCLQT